MSTLVKIGGLWRNQSKNGVEYFSGSIKVGEITQRVVIFKNKNKVEGEKYPDWIVYESEDREKQPEKPKEDGSEVPF